MSGKIDRRTLLRTVGVGGITTAVASGSGIATGSGIGSVTGPETVEFDWADGTKENWEKIEVRDGQLYRYGYSSHVYEFNIVDDEPISGDYSPQIECLNDGIYVQSPDLVELLDGQSVASVSGTFRLEGDLDASDWNNNRFRVNDADGERNGYVRFDHEEMRLEWRGDENEELTTFEAGVTYEIEIAVDGDQFTVTVDGDEYDGLEPDDGQEASIHTVDMRSRNWGGVGSSIYDDSIYFTWDAFTAVAESEDDDDDEHDDGEGTDAVDDFTDGLDCWDTSGNVEIVSEGAVTDESMRLDDADRSSATWECAGVFDTHDRVEFRGIYRANQSAFQHRFRLYGADEDLYLLINTSDDAIYFATSPLDSPGDEPIDDAFADTWAVFRLALDGSGAVFAKVWELGTDEPTDWQLTDELDSFTFEFRAGVGGNDHDRELLVDLVEADTDPDEGELGTPYDQPPETGDSAFRIGGVEPAEPTVQPSETVILDVDVTNDGDRETVEPLTLTLEQQEVDAFELELAAEESGSVSLVIDGDELADPGTYEYTVETAEDSSTGVVTVEDTDPGIVITEVTPADPVVQEGDSLFFDVGVTNEGEREEPLSVTLSIDDTTIETIDAELDPDETDWFPFDVDPGELDGPGEYEYVVEAGGDSASGTIVVEGEPSLLAIDDVDYSHDELAPEEAFQIVVTVANRGGEPGLTPVTVVLDGDELGTDEAAVDPGEAERVSFDAQAPSTEGTLTVVVATDDDELGETIPVHEDDSDPGSGDEMSSDDGSSDDGDDDVLFEMETDGTPGFGLLGPIASLGGTAYVLKRRAERTIEDRD